MRSVHEWLAEYGQSHRDPTNERIHWVCVPVIMFSLLGMLWRLPVPGELPVWLNWSTLLVLAALLYYLVLAPPLALGMAGVALVNLLALHALDSARLPLLELCLALFVAAWVGQFVGHRVEGRKPSFFKDLQFLLIGPLWLLAAAYRRLGWRY